MSYDDLGYLMRVNVGDNRIREKSKLLLVGSCMKSRYPEIVRDFENQEGRIAVLDVCLEETHVNQAGFKIASIVRYSGLKKIIALTIDGSPHCVQLHYVIEDIKRHFTPEIETSHFIVEKGKLIQVNPDVVKYSRHLSKIQKMLEREC